VKRLLCLSIFFFALAWTLQPAPEASSQSIPLKPIVQSLPAQVKGIPTVPLIVEGDVVKTVRKLPFKVFAPPPEKEPKDGKFYTRYGWSLPLGLQGNYSPISNVCEITYAAKGQYTIQVEILDWTSDGFSIRLGKETVVFNETMPGPTPPGPEPPGPVDQFEKDLFAAWKAEPTDISRPLLLAALARETGKAAEIDQNLTTVYQLYQKIWLEVVTSKFKPIADPGAELVAIRKLIGAELNSVLPKQANAPLDAANRQLCKTHFNRIATSLEKLEGVK